MTDSFEGASDQVSLAGLPQGTLSDLEHGVADLTGGGGGGPDYVACSAADDLT